MSLGTLLQTIITVIFIYLILSLLASEIQEYIASIAEFRAKRLKESIKQLLGEDKHEYNIATATLNRVVKDLVKKIDEKEKKDKLKPALQTVIQELKPYIATGKDTETDKLQTAIKQLKLYIATDRETETGKLKSALQTAIQELETYIATDRKTGTDKLKSALQTAIQELETYIATDREAINKLKKVSQAVKEYRKRLEQKTSLTKSLYENLIPSLNQSATLIRSYIFSFLPCKNRRNRTSEGPSYIEPKLFAQALLQTINDSLDSLQIEKLKRADDIDNAIKKLESTNLNSNAKNKLIQIASELKLEKDNPKLDDFKAKLEELFEEAQVRSSGVYKRNAKGFSFVLGLIIAIIANADPFYIVGNLSKNNNDYRDRVVNKLDENQEQLFLDRSEEDAFGEDERELVKNILDEVGTLPLGWNYDRELKAENLESLIEVLSKKNNGNTCFDEDGEDTQPLENTACFNQFLEDIENQPHLGTYIGQDPNAKPLIEGLNYIEDCLEPKGNINECWQNKVKNHDFPTTYTTYRQSLENQQLSQRINNIKTRDKIDFGNIINKPANLIKKSGNQIEKQGGWWQVLFGWVISAIAISMGAPFWFDLLGKVMNVRNTKKSQKTDSVDSIKEGKTSEN